MIRAFVIAGEPSGDRLGAALMAGLEELAGEVEFHGIGGVQMAGQGLASLFPMEELSIMGIVEVLPKYRAIMRRINQTAAEVIRLKPDILITIDSPDFCLRVASRVRAAAPGVRICHYVAPSVWAWRPGRAVKMARHVDQVLCLLPFEPPYMEAAGMRADFVGHPAVAEPVALDAEVAALRAELGLGEAPVLVVLPGSRKGEVSRMLPVFGAALNQVVAARSGLRVLVPAAGPVADAVMAGVAGWPGQPLVLDPRGRPVAEAEARKRAAFAMGEAALAASGTVSVELAMAGTPAVIAYDMNRLTFAIMKRIVKVTTVTLINLVAGRNVVPECLGPDCTPDKVAAALTAVLTDAGARADQLAAMNEALDKLGRGGPPPGLRAARAVLEGLGKAAD